MSKNYHMDRREFIRTTAGAITAGLGVSAAMDALGQEASRGLDRYKRPLHAPPLPPMSIEEAAYKVGRLPRHKLGNTGRWISALVGTGDWAPEAIEAGILSGVNCWLKASTWKKDSGGPRTTPQAILKNREGFYCEVLVDRVRGNHETGQFDAEAHYQFVKQAVARTGLHYFDDMKFHAGYHNVAELKNDRGFVRAFERLKKEGLVRHLCLSQHSYNGNPRVPGGESALEILQAILADGAYEHAQFFFTYGESEIQNTFIGVGHSVSGAFVRAARRKGFGTIAMKTMWGVPRMKEDVAFMKNFPAGTTPHHAVARWLTTKTDLDAAVIMIKSLDEFVDTFSGAGKAMRAADTRALKVMTAYANREVCRLCSECMGHCPNGVEIADILRYERYATDYHEKGRARTLYAQVEKQADACVACGTCLPHCPQGLNIPVKLADAHRLLS
jgi:predicted aldo/keto reductase-like oxidoreductase